QYYSCVVAFGRGALGAAWSKDNGGHRPPLQILKWLYRFAFLLRFRSAMDTTAPLTPLISNLSGMESKSFTSDFIVMSAILCARLSKRMWPRSGFPVTTAGTSLFLSMSLANGRITPRMTYQ